MVIPYLELPYKTAMISKEEVIKIAELSHLSFDEDELEKITKDMEEIIEFANLINKAVDGDTDDIKNIATKAVPYEECRYDEILESLPNEKILSNVDGARGMFYVKGGI